MTVEYISDLSPLSNAVIKHIPHKYSAQMSKKSEVVVLDVLMKNEAKHSNMIDILKQMVGYLGDNYPHQKRVASGGDQLTTDRLEHSVMLCVEIARKTALMFLSHKQKTGIVL